MNVLQALLKFFYFPGSLVSQTEDFAIPMSDSTLKSLVEEFDCGQRKLLAAVQWQFDSSVNPTHYYVEAIKLIFDYVEPARGEEDILGRNIP
jgi:hypothetical protein